MVGPLLVVLLLLLFSALYVAAEFSAVSVRRARIRQKAEQGSAVAARLLPVLEDPRRLDRYISGSQMGITVTSLVVGAFAQGTLAVQLVPLFARWFRLRPAAAVSVTTVAVLLVLTMLQMVLSELVPKYLALARPTQVALFTVLPMKWSLTVFGPFISFLNGSAAAVLRLFGIPEVGHRHIHSPEEIDLLIAESRDGGMLEPDEHRRLRRALQLGIRPARHLMVPRNQISAIEISTPPDEVMRIVAESPYTRLPVYRQDIDDIVGVLHTRDLFVRELSGGGVAGTGIDALLRPVLQVPETVTAEQLLARMRESRTHQAVLLDEFGGVSGLVTLDDVLTEVMGDVGDELKGDEPGPERLPDGRVRLPGWLRVDEAEPWIGAYLEGESDTLGGRITEELGHVPAVGEQVRIHGVEMEVESVLHHAVAWIVARPRRGVGGRDEAEEEHGG
ncbi:hemolysin family protein [Longimicrobium sp.]|uniref:hemolysin family protein n=1 Tax=Longimicrobium sp. TaxID=2029185 RepID=UPI002CB11920|nr:hemolysin family protein [Longimicrobium sp.]HSU14184.1 hemolysin family protein [Longimicrobium sp.]